VISATENSKKPGFGRKNQLRTRYHLGPTAEATLIILISCFQMDPNNETTGPGTSVLGFCETFGLGFRTFGLEL
jgi:hypothetical protein